MQAIPSSGDSNLSSKFTPQQIELFNTRFSEGYNVYVDQEYVAWLQLTHPEVVPQDITTSPNGPTLLDVFADVTPMEPIPVTNPTDQISRLHKQVHLLLRVRVLHPQVTQLIKTVCSRHQHLTGFFTKEYNPT